MPKDDYQTISICKSQRYATTPTAHKKYQGVYDIEKKRLRVKTKYSVVIKEKGFQLDLVPAIICYHLVHKLQQLFFVCHFSTTLYRANLKTTHFSHILIKLQFLRCDCEVTKG